MLHVVWRNQHVSSWAILYLPGYDKTLVCEDVVVLCLCHSIVVTWVLSSWPLRSASLGIQPPNRAA